LSLEKTWPCAHLRLTGSAFVLMPITLHRFSTPTPLPAVPQRNMGGYYLKKGR
jgi:hypothetical protein